ncbi:Glucose-6-phosphate dehydrogenase, NAD-binding [Dillenia turbinata]|uniref:glucose-6-phosphate dehydrogenase (NADP(+)) n=1 Tax=Dillenia turbinata TaxID=194707 RepID=A0AAN8VMV1_9MAGN
MSKEKRHINCKEEILGVLLVVGWEEQVRIEGLFSYKPTRKLYDLPNVAHLEAVQGMSSCNLRLSIKSDSFIERRSFEGLESGCLSIIVLGDFGDFAKKKTFPALFNLYRQGFLHLGEVHIFGYARTKISDDDLRDRIRGYLLHDKDNSNLSIEVLEFLQLVNYVSGSYDSKEGFGLLDQKIVKHEFS